MLLGNASLVAPKSTLERKECENDLGIGWMARTNLGGNWLRLSSDGPAELWPIFYRIGRWPELDSMGYGRFWKRTRQFCSLCVCRYVLQ